MTDYMSLYIRKSVVDASGTRETLRFGQNIAALFAPSVFKMNRAHV